MLLGSGCFTTSDSRKLPYFGEYDIQKTEAGSDTIYYPIPKFILLNQDSQPITESILQGKIGVVDFFFTDCPSICPILSSQMARLQQRLQQTQAFSRVQLLSVSVNPTKDNPSVLKAYAERLNAQRPEWTFATGGADDIYRLAEKGFMLSAFPSDTAAGGIFHTDKVTLLDSERKIRGYYDGTSTKSMDQLFDDLQLLIKEPVK
ncbi:MAG: SCO family protein [Flavobacteriales bacterium]